MTTVERRKLGLTHYDNKTAGGYTLFAPQTGGGRVPLIDDSGELVHEWHMPVRPGRDAVILPNGNLGYNGCHNTSVDLYPPWDIWHGGHFMEATKDSDIVWEYEDPYAHHDAQWLAGGLLYVAAAEYRMGEYSDIVRMVNRKGETVWEWCAWDHITEEEFPTHAGFPDNHWPMINGVCLSGNTIHMSLETPVVLLSRQRNKRYCLENYGPRGTTTLPVVTDTGTLVAFCNGNIRPTEESSRIVEFDLETKEMVWSYVDDMLCFLSSYMGSTKIVNGNTFICESIW